MKGEFAKEKNRMNNISFVEGVVRLGLGDKKMITEKKLIFWF